MRLGEYLSRERIWCSRLISGPEQPQHEEPCYPERCRIALTNKAVTGPCSNLVLCSPSALSTLAGRFSYTT